MKNMRNLRKCVLWTVVTTAILILTTGTAYSGSVELTSDGKVPGKPFEYLQQQIDNLQQQIDNIPGSEPTRFTDMGDGTIRDNDTGLIWLKDANCRSLPFTDTLGRADWVGAGLTAEALADGTCGLTDGSEAGDWRLPTMEEWVGLMSNVYDNPALVNRVGDAKWYDGDAFIRVAFGGSGVMYWSSTEHTSVDYAWAARLDIGDFGVPSKDSTWGHYIWPVRSDN